MSESEYDAAMAEIRSLARLNPGLGTPDTVRLRHLVSLAEAYEREHYPRQPVDPITAIRFRMEQAGLQPKDLVPYLGSRSRVSEVLAGKRPLTLRMIRNLRYGLGIPAETLIAEASPAPRPKPRRKAGNAGRASTE